MNCRTKGYALGAIAAATYGMNPLFALPLYDHGMDPDSVLFFRYLFAIPILGTMIRARGRNFRIRRNELASLAALGLLVALSSLTLFRSYNHMAAGIASTLLFVYPILVALIMAAVFGERLSASASLCIAVAFGGICLLYKTADGATLNPTGTALVFLSALSYAVYIVGANRPSIRGIATLKVTFYVLVFGVAVFFVSTGLCRELTLPDRWYLWGNLLALAVFPTIVSFGCTNSAIKYIGSTPTAILGALEPVTALFFGIAVFGERISIRESIGLTLIILAVTMVVAGDRMTVYMLRLRKMFPRLPRLR